MRINRNDGSDTNQMPQARPAAAQQPQMPAQQPAAPKRRTKQKKRKEKTTQKTRASPCGRKNTTRRKKNPAAVSRWLPDPAGVRGAGGVRRLPGPAAVPGDRRRGHAGRGTDPRDRAGLLRRRHRRPAGAGRHRRARLVVPAVRQVQWPGQRHPVRRVHAAPRHGLYSIIQTISQEVRRPTTNVHHPRRHHRRRRGADLCGSRAGGQRRYLPGLRQRHRRVGFQPVQFLVRHPRQRPPDEVRGLSLPRDVQRLRRRGRLLLRRHALRRV